MIVWGAWSLQQRQPAAHVADRELVQAAARFRQHDGARPPARECDDLHMPMLRMNLLASNWEWLPD